MVTAHPFEQACSRCSATHLAGAGLGQAHLWRGGHQGSGFASVAPGLVSEWLMSG